MASRARRLTEAQRLAAAKELDRRHAERQIRRGHGYSEAEIERGQARIKALFDAAGMPLDEESQP